MQRDWILSVVRNSRKRAPHDGAESPGDPQLHGLNEEREKEMLFY